MSNTIRTITICVFSHLDNILVCEFPDSVKGDIAARPLGGGVEFGETSEQALIREIHEELGQEIENLQLLGVIESLFEYEGSPGHENVYVYDAEFVDKSLYKQDKIRVIEGSSETVARWRSTTHLQTQMRLVPDGLLKLIPRKPHLTNTTI